MGPCWKVRQQCQGREVESNFTKGNHFGLVYFSYFCHFSCLSFSLWSLAHQGSIIMILQHSMTVWIMQAILGCFLVFCFLHEGLNVHLYVLEMFCIKIRTLILSHQKAKIVSEDQHLVIHLLPCHSPGFSTSKQRKDKKFHLKICNLEAPVCKCVKIDAAAYLCLLLMSVVWTEEWHLWRVVCICTQYRGCTLLFLI